MEDRRNTPHVSTGTILRTTAGVTDDSEPVFMRFIPYTAERGLLFAALRAAGHPHPPTDDGLLFPEGGSRSGIETFLLVFQFLREGCLSKVI